MKEDILNLKLCKTIKSLINVSDEELIAFISLCQIRTVAKREPLAREGERIQDYYFIEEGILRFCITDKRALEHTVHFAMENGFASDYSALISNSVANYTLESLETCKVVVIPYSSMEWIFENFKEGYKLVRIITEYIFKYMDRRVQQFYVHTPKEKFELMNILFPNILNRVPQHMIASYIGITSVHLSRIKN